MRTTLLTLAFCIFLINISFAQSGLSEKDLAKTMTVTAPGTFGKPKIIPTLEKLALAQITVNYKQISSKETTKTEKKSTLIGRANVARATASVSAYLNITDEDLTDEDYQQITDHFYRYFQSTLQKNNIDTIAWSKVMSSELYKSGKEKKEKEDDSKQQSSVSYNANMGTTIFNGAITFAYGKSRKAAAFCEEVNAPAAFINTTVDFADIIAEIDVKTRGGGNVWTPSYASSRPVTKMKSKTTVRAFMKIPANSGNSLFFNSKLHSENLFTVEDIPAEMDYADELTEDPSLLKKKSKLFSISFSHKLESTPVIISTTKAAYIAAAKKALERYADAFIAKTKEAKS